MGRMGKRFALSVVMLVFTACQPWPEQLDTAIACEDPRAPERTTITPQGGSVDTDYARVEFDAGTFETPTVVVMTPYQGLHGFHLQFPEEPDTPSPPMRAYFYLDVCGTPERATYRIATRERIEPASIRRAGPRQEPEASRAAAWREIQAGELDDELDGAGFTPLLPIRGGFVVLSN